MSRLLTVTFLATALLCGCASTPSRTPAPPPPPALPAEAEGTGEAQAQEAAAPAPPLELEVVLYFGCRGDVDQAQTVEVAQGEDLPGDTLPENACLTGLDASPPPPPPAYADCSGEGLGSGRYQTESFQQRLARIEEQQRVYDEELLPAHEQRLERLRTLFPQGPYLCIRVTNPGDVTRRRVAVQYYSRPASALELCVDAGEEPFVRKSGNDGLRMDAVLLSDVEPGATATRCVRVPEYADMRHGALLAGDEAEAEAFVRQYMDALDAQELGGEAASAQGAPPSTPWPHAEVSTEYLQSCNHACY